MRLVENGEVAVDSGWLAGNQTVGYDNGFSIIVMACDNTSRVWEKVLHTNRTSSSCKAGERKESILRNIDIE